jgi:hypothetical protein
MYGPCRGDPGVVRPYQVPGYPVGGQARRSPLAPSAWSVRLPWVVFRTVYSIYLARLANGHKSFTCFGNVPTKLLT